MGIALEPLEKATGKKLSFSVCDIESMKWTEFLVIGSYDGRVFDVFSDIVEYFEFIIEKYPKSHTVFAHFGGRFDFIFLMQEAFNSGSFYVENLIARGSGILSFELRKKNTKKKIKFTDSSAILPYKLATLCESFNVDHKKKEWDHLKTEKLTAELVEYLKHDCIGLYEVIQRFSGWELIKEAGLRTTMASQALQVFKLYLKSPIYSLSEELDEFVRKSYFGGRTEIFRPDFSLKGKRLYCYDVNSLYPYVMMKNQFPVYRDDIVEKFNDKKLGFYEVDIEVPEMYVPPLGAVLPVGRFRKSNKFIFPTGLIRGFFTSEEIKYAMSLGAKLLKVRHGITFKSGGKIFKDYISELYEMRLGAKKKGDLVTDTITKLLMNSLYGRFGLSRDRENLVFGYDNMMDGSVPYLMLKLNVGDLQIFKNPVSLDNSFSNVAVASFVTSYARIHMHKIYMNCQDDLFYTDTDSIFTTKRFESGKNLGELKLEYETGNACFLLPKTYLVDDIKGLRDGKTGEDIIKKVVMKGFDSRKIKQFEMDDFLTALEGELRVLRVESKDPPGLMTFKSALRTSARVGGKLVRRQRDYVKQIQSQYDKRVFFKNSFGKYDSRPLHMKDGVAI